VSGTIITFQLHLFSLQLVDFALEHGRVGFQQVNATLDLFETHEGIILFRSKMKNVGAHFGLDKFGLCGVSRFLIGRFNRFEKILQGESSKCEQQMNSELITN
jgi:hypothetical protein